MASEDEDSEKSLKVLGIAEIGKIPCARESFLYGSLGGIVVGLGHFLATSRVSRSCYIGLGGYVLTTLGFWFHCRYNYAKRRFEQRMIREGMKNMILFEGTQYDPTRRATTIEEKRP